MATKTPRPPAEVPPIRDASPEEAARGREGVAQAKVNALQFYSPEEMEHHRKAGEKVALRRLDNLWANDEMRSKQKRGEILGPRGW
jgi:hypothetical protein